MATKSSTRVAPKATKTVKTKTGKTKTVPAKKPSTKPAAKTTKSSSTASVTTPAPKHHYGMGAIIGWIIGAIACIALVTIGIIALVNCVNEKKAESALVVKDGEGTEVATAYINFSNDSFRMKIPTSFTAYDKDKLATEYNGTDSAEAVYESADKTANIIIASNSGATVTNDQIPAYLDTMKSVFNATGKVISDNLITKDGRNIGTMQITIDTTDTNFYEELAFFSIDNKLVIVTFSCDETHQAKWQPVGEFIIKSISILK